MRHFPPFAAAALLLAACGSENPNGKGDGGLSCSGCMAGEVCDPSTGTCVTAIPEAAPCTTPDGGVVPGRCDEGLTCGSVGGGPVWRCSRECTLSDEAQICTATGKCYKRPDDSGGYCGTVATEGASCDAARLSYCSGQSLTCMTPSQGRTDGLCFAYCDVTQPDPAGCGTGRSCADLFPAAPTKGICVTAPAAGGHCDYQALVFCGRGQVCVRPTDATWGFCHDRCSGSTACGTRECVTPAPGVSICVTPVARCVAVDPATCPSCSAAADAYCAAADICVEVSSHTVCKADCTTGGQAVCPPGTVCSSLGASTSKACL